MADTYSGIQKEYDDMTPFAQAGRNIVEAIAERPGVLGAVVDGFVDTKKDRMQRLQAQRADEDYEYNKRMRTLNLQGAERGERMESKKEELYNRQYEATRNLAGEQARQAQSASMSQARRAEFENNRAVFNTMQNDTLQNTYMQLPDEAKSMFSVDEFMIANGNSSELNNHVMMTVLPQLYMNAVNSGDDSQLRQYVRQLGAEFVVGKDGQEQIVLDNGTVVPVTKEGFSKISNEVEKQFAERIKGQMQIKQMQMSGSAYGKISGDFMNDIIKLSGNDKKVNSVKNAQEAYSKLSQFDKQMGGKPMGYASLNHVIDTINDPKIPQDIKNIQMQEGMQMAEAFGFGVQMPPDGNPLGVMIYKKDNPQEMMSLSGFNEYIKRTPEFKQYEQMVQSIKAPYIEQQRVAAEAEALKKSEEHKAQIAADEEENPGITLGREVVERFELSNNVSEVIELSKKDISEIGSIIGLGSGFMFQSLDMGMDFTEAYNNLIGYYARELDIKESQVLKLIPYQWQSRYYYEMAKKEAERAEKMPDTIEQDNRTATINAYVGGLAGIGQQIGSGRTETVVNQEKEAVKKNAEKYAKENERVKKLMSAKTSTQKQETAKLALMGE